MAGSVSVRVHSLVNVSLNASAKLSELIRFMEMEAPEQMVIATTDAMAEYAAGTLRKGYGLRTGTLKGSIEEQVIRRSRGYYRARVQTTATRGEQRAAEYAMRQDEHDNAGPRTGVHARGRKFQGGLPFVGRGDDEGYAVYVEEGRPNRRPVPFMSHARGVGAVFMRREAAEAMAAKIKAAMEV